jgi:hypothetical protein
MNDGLRRSLAPPVPPLRDEKEKPMERNVSIIRSDLASAAGSWIPLVAAS